MQSTLPVEIMNKEEKLKALLENTELEKVELEKILADKATADLYHALLEKKAKEYGSKLEKAFLFGIRPNSIIIVDPEDP